MEVATQKKPKFKKHKIVNRTSVDESLFGPPARLNQMSGNRTWTDSTAETLEGGRGSGPGDRGRVTGGRTRRMSDDPDVVKIITKDLIRKIKVPSTPDPSGRSVVLDTNDYSRILQRAQMLSVQERKEAEAQQKAHANDRMEASNARKREMQELEYSRRKNEKPSDLEQEKIEQGQDMIARATELLNEQDDEIKKLNEYVLNAKCHAIRDAQLQEKEDIVASFKEEEARLDKMMEIERQRAMENYDRKEKEIQLQRYKGAEVLLKQIKENEQQHLLDLEKKDQETQAMLKYLERLQEEDLEALEKKRHTQQALMKEVKHCNDEMQRQKTQLKEQMKLEDLKVLEYIKEKTRLDEEFQAELARQKAEKEREIARLRAQQERAKDKQAEKDALRAKRRQEEFERIARRKEKEAAEKKQATEKMLIDSRNQQVQHKEHFLALQAMQDRKEFERVLKDLQDKTEEERQKSEKLASMRHTHAQEIRKQVREKEEEKIAKRRDFFDEGKRLTYEAQERKRKLDAIKQQKLEELRAAGVPDKYCAEVSRRITAPPPSFTMAGHN